MRNAIALSLASVAGAALLSGGIWAATPVPRVAKPEFLVPAAPKGDKVIIMPLRQDDQVSAAAVNDRFNQAIAHNNQVIQKMLRRANVADEPLEERAIHAEEALDLPPPHNRALR